MVARKRRTIHPTMEQGRRRFERWRKARPASSPIPDTLWTLAVGIARGHGVNQTAQTRRGRSGG